MLKRIFTKEEIERALCYAAEHYANVINKTQDMTDFVGEWSAQDVRTYLLQRESAVIVYPMNNTFTARGTARSLERGLNNLRHALCGHAGYRWLWYWVKSEE